jgi:hypothetical protein
MLCAVKAKAPPPLLNAVDDMPLRYRDLFAFLAAAEGMAPPDPGGPRLHLRNCVLTN